MAEDEKPYNPLDRVELGKSIERALLARPLQPLPPADRFRGAGVYAIYYTGRLPLYSAIAPPRRAVGEIPIYVGRARPEGARRGGVADSLEGSTSQTVLYRRLRDHAKSIRSVEEHFSQQREEGLRLSDFVCRYLVSDDIWVTLGEAVLIAHYLPVWNVVVDGFGNHAVGVGRGNQKRSPWDELHPGRPWAFDLLRSPQSAAELEDAVRAHFATAPEPNLDVAPAVDEKVRAAMDSAPEDEEPDAEQDA